MDRLRRRDFLKISALTIGGICFTQLPLLADTLSPARTADAPIRDIGADFTSKTFGGDDFTKPHSILWHLDEYIAGKGGWPSTISEEREVIIIGGGLSGLLTAHELRDRDWILLEQAARLGGNSKSEEYRGALFSQGAAYITIPDLGSHEERLLREIGLLGSGRIEKSDETRVLLGGLKNLWHGETDPAARSSAQRIETALKEVNATAFPDIPWNSSSALSREQLARLDSLTAEEWLLKLGPLHPHVREYFQIYAWSAFGGSLDEISAAQFLNFAAPETDGVLAFPGGNGAIAQALVDTLRKSEDRLRAKTLVIDVRINGDRAEVLMETEAGELRVLSAKSVVMTAPKFVALRILRHLIDPERLRLWKSISYRAYMVANIRLKSKIVSPGFDVFGLRGRVPDRPTFGHRTDRNLVDFIFADWANEDRSGTSILSVYRPFPLDGARNILMGPGLHERMQKEFREEMAHWLPQLGLAADAIEDIRLTLWGHSCPLAKVGRFADGSLDKIPAPLENRILFANQDDSMNPAFESCFASARRAARQALALLDSPI